MAGSITKPNLTAHKDANSANLLVKVSGTWTIFGLDGALPEKLQISGPCQVDCSELQKLDTSGAFILLEALGIVQNHHNTGGTLNLVQCQPRYKNIIELVRTRFKDSAVLEVVNPTGCLEDIGRGFFDLLAQLRSLMGFVGQLSLEIYQSVRYPRLARPKEFFAQLELVLVDAIPVICLVTFLIGIVIAYLFALQLQRYGANIFIVDGIALAMCRELSPIIVAIIVAGRSGSAFTAQLGSMKLNEEIDAMTTIGLSPIRVLVLPRILALVCAIPLLVFIGDVIGIAGGAIIARSYLDVGSTAFIERLNVALPIRHVIVGLIKAPVFALFIGMIACRLGLSVENNSRSLGLNTTRTVVQSIVSVILLNAVFAVFFAELVF